MGFGKCKNANEYQPTIKTKVLCLVRVGWQDPSPVPVAMAPATPVNGLDTSNDPRNALYGMTGNQDINKPRTRQEGFK